MIIASNDCKRDTTNRQVLPGAARRHGGSGRRAGRGGLATPSYHVTASHAIVDCIVVYHDIFLSLSLSLYIYICIHTYIYRMCIYIYIYVCTLYIYIYIYYSICCVYIYIYMYYSICCVITFEQGAEAGDLCILFHPS